MGGTCHQLASCPDVGNGAGRYHLRATRLHDPPAILREARASMPRTTQGWIRRTSAE